MNPPVLRGGGQAWTSQQETATVGGLNSKVGGRGVEINESLCL